MKFRLYLAWSMHTWAIRSLEALDWNSCPTALLVSFYYLKSFKPHRAKFRPARTMLDSGAYSAYNAGKTVDVDALIEETKDPFWNESVALDVIGDGDKSLANALYMQSKGSPAFPVFHIGEPLTLLDEYVHRFPKVGLSCRFGESEKVSINWLKACFHRRWPHRYHSFGWTSESMLKQFPFESADASSWVVAPASFGRWPMTFGTLSVRGKICLQSEIAGYRAIENRVQARWRSTYEAVEAQVKDHETDVAAKTPRDTDKRPSHLCGSHSVERKQRDSGHPKMH